jgi:cytochrome P450
MTITAPAPLTTHGDIDLSARSFWAKPAAERDAAFAVLRRENPVPWSRPVESDLLPPELNTKGFWSLTKHEDIRLASRHPEIFSSADGVIMESFAPELTELVQSFIAMDAPRHTQLRGITMDAFKPKNMRTLEGWIRNHARDLVGEVAGRGEGDFAVLVSKVLPARIFSSMFGLPPGEMNDRTVDACQRLLAFTDPEVCGDQTGLEVLADAMMDIHMTAAEIVPERRANPGDDLMTWLALAEFDGERMTDDEIGAFLVMVGVAANDTTRHASAAAIHLFSQHPEQRRLLVQDVPGRIDGAVEEVLRCSHPLNHMRRTAIQDTVIRGQEIKTGENVVLWYCSGNRDEEIFDDPFRFDIFRSPNPHVTFGGGGPHFCLGAALARTTLKSLLSEVYTRIPDIHSGEPDFLIGNFSNGIKRLPAEWTPEKRG